MSAQGLPQEIQRTVDSLNKSIDSIQLHVDSFLKAPIDELSAELTSEEVAKLSVLMAYALNTLYFVYLKTQGVAPNDHPVIKELERVKEHIQKLKDLSKPKATPNLTLNKEAADRFIKHALTSIDLDQKSKEGESGEGQKNEKEEKGKAAAAAVAQGDSTTNKKRKKTKKGSGISSGSNSNISKKNKNNNDNKSQAKSPQKKPKNK